MDRSTLKCTGSYTTKSEESKGDAVLIPILQNSKPVKKGDELLTYDGDLEVPTLTIEPQVPASAPKRSQEEAAESAPKRPRKEAAESTLQGEKKPTGRDCLQAVLIILL